MNDDDVFPDDDQESEVDALQPTVSAADPAGKRRQETRIKREVREAREFWQSVFASPVGRREMWGILQAGHAFEERFACGPNGFPQPEATWFHAGEQAFVQRLGMSWSVLDRAGYFLMLDEHDPRFAKPRPPRKRRDA